MARYITKLVVDSPWAGGGGGEVFYVGFRGGKHFFGAVRGGANLFFCPPDVVFISDDHVINATSLRMQGQKFQKVEIWSKNFSFVC